MKRKKKLIIHIISGLEPHGAELMLYKLSGRLANSKYKQHVISLTSDGDLGDQIREFGISVTALNMKSGKLAIFRFFKLIKLLYKLNPDIVHTWMYHADFLGGLAAKFTGCKTIIWGIRHSNLSPRYNKKSMLLLVRLCAFLSRWVPQQIFCCSDSARITHIQAGYKADKMCVIPNGLDLDLFQPNKEMRVSVRDELSLGLGVPLVGFVARYNIQKNHLGFLEAVSELHKTDKDVHFLFVGSEVDNENTELAKAIENAEIGDVVHLLGERKDIPRIMASLDILCSPSVGEAFPNVLCEAMACEVVCVVTDVGDSSEIVGNTGVVVQSGDMQGLASGMLKIFSLPAPELRVLKQKAKERVQNKYDISNVALQYVSAYDNLIKNN